MTRWLGALLLRLVLVGSLLLAAGSMVAINPAGATSIGSSTAAVGAGQGSSGQDVNAASSNGPAAGTPSNGAETAAGENSAGGTATTSTPAAPLPPRLVLEQQTAWTSSGGEFSARLRLPANHGTGHLDASIYGALDDPAQVATTAKGEELSGTRRRVPTIEISSSDSTAVVRVPVGSDRSRGAFNLSPGVYPLVIELSGDTLDQVVRLITHIVVVPASGSAKTRTVGVVVRVDQPFRWTPDGRLEVVGDPDQLFRNTAPLRDHPDIPVTLMITPGTLSALANTPSGNRSYTALVGLAQRNQVMNGSFAPLPVGSWATNRLDQALVEQFADGESTLTSALGRAPTGSTWLVSPTDNPSVLRWLSDRGVRTFLVPDTISPTPPDAPFRVNELAAPHVAVRLEGVKPPTPGGDASRAAPTVADAYELLARLALPALLRPDDTAPPAAILLDDLSNEGLPYLKAMLDGLAPPGPLAPNSADGVHAEVEANRPRLQGWSMPAPQSTDLGSLGGELDALHAAGASFQSSVGRDDPTTAAVHRAVLALPGMSAVERAGVVSSVQALVRRELGTVQITRDQPITVTAHHAELPITVHNSGPRALTVSFQASSSDLEIQGPQVRTLRLDAGATIDVIVPVRVNRSGDFRLDVRVASADGLVPLADGALTVRSTAISGVGVVLSLGALAFLAVWWGRHIRRTRRARRQIEVPTPLQAEPDRVGEPVR